MDRFDGHPPSGVVAIFVIGTVLMRSAGCAINDYADRDFDKHVARTVDRPLDVRQDQGLGSRGTRGWAVGRARSC